MCIGINGRFAGSPDEVGVAWIVFQVEANNNRVGKEPDLVLELGASAVRDWRANGNVFLTGNPRKQDPQSGQRHHERRDLQLTGS